MSADLLREVAASIRENAQALSTFTEVPWLVEFDEDWEEASVRMDDAGPGYCEIAKVAQGEHSEALAQHLATVGHPRLALVLADALDRAAENHDGEPCPVIDGLLRVARVYTDWSVA